MTIKEDLKGQSAALWEKAKTLIPGGNQLLSKRAEMFLPGQWPAYYKKAKGVEVWDLDDKRYIDMSIMGIGACTLGYANKELDQAVKHAIDQGVATTLNCMEEVQLAEALIGLHPWSAMARFAKTGGEVNAIAIRIARAHTKKDKIAFCGYHGWSDWYLAANLAKDNNLDGQLLPGLEPAGVPRGLIDSAIPFNYGKIEELKQIVTRNMNEIGVIMMEIARFGAPDMAFVREVRGIADEIGAVLIFDEVSSGFRANTGGMHLLHGVNPDMMTLAKALGNGYPIAAVLGKKAIMQAAQNSFISSTNWTERTGFAAALEVIRQYQEYDVAQHTMAIADMLRQGLRSIFTDYGLKIDMIGMPSVAIMAIKEENPLVVKTVFTQEMLKKGYLAGTVIFLSLAHNKKIIEAYLKEAEEVFGRIAGAIKHKKLESLLEGPVCHGGFKRLN